MKFEEIKGDLFGCEENVSFAHCISEDCRMGKGIAVLFKQKFGGVSDLQKQVSSGAKTGHVAVLERNNRFVYYLITKKKYSDKPTYETLKRSLIDMKEHMVENKVTKLAMPRIGCGLDGLQWNLVSPIIKNVFFDTDIDITVYYL